MEIRAAILVVSDTASSDPLTDKATDILANVFLTDGRDQWIVSDKQIVRDDVLAIQRQICAWTDEIDPPNLIISTGGTGFSVKDNTPEAVQPLIHKHAPGLV